MSSGASNPRHDGIAFAETEPGRGARVDLAPDPPHREGEPHMMTSLPTSLGASASRAQSPCTRTRTRAGRLAAWAVSAAALCGAALGAEPGAPVKGVDFKTVHVFTQVEGPFTTGVVEGRDGYLYGVNTFGGEFDDGIAFRMSPKGEFQLLHAFAGAPKEGENPYGRLVAGSDGNLYGTTNRGGQYDLGTIFRLTPEGQVKVLHSFGAPGDSDSPFAGVIQARDGTLYGTTCTDVVGSFDSVFAITTAGAYRTVYKFANAADGYCPHGDLLEASDGLLYGTTLRGGQFNEGTAFSVSPSGQHVLLHSFDGTDGDELQGGLIQASDGQFYGATSYGGANDEGTVFRMDAAGNVTTLHDFGASAVDGQVADAGLVDGGDGYLYGTTTYGGDGGKACSFNPCGTIYRITLDGSLGIVHDFGTTFMGAHPSVQLARISGNRLAGTADWRDVKVRGTIFTLRTQP
jgi:uncharacterized repeat protein (TIGR03803 family)